jgi:hypothetical protein
MKKIAVSVAISCVFLYLAVRNVSFSEVKSALSEAEYIWLIPGMIIVVFSFFLRAIRWRYLLEGTKRVSLMSSFSVIMIGFMANNIFPARIGEVARAFVLGKKEGISKSLSFGTIVLERVFDGLTLTFILGVSMVFSPFPEWVKGLGITGIILFGFFSIFLLFLKTKQYFILSLFENRASLFSKSVSERIAHILHRFIDGLESLGRLKHISLIFFWSLLAWFLLGVEFHIFLLSFGISDLPFYAPYFTMAVVGLGVMIPSAPGYIGVFQSFCVAALSLFGVEKSLALSYSIIVHIAQYIPITGAGLIFLAKEHISFSYMVKPNEKG